MAHTKVTKNGTQNNGTANTFSYSGSFDVFKAAEVEVELDNVKLTFTTSTINESASPREYTVDYTNKTVHIGGANLASTNSVTIQPVTDLGKLTNEEPKAKATYQPGASITSADLNNNQLQLMRKALEYDEQKLSSRGGTMTGNLHFGKNVDLSFEGDTDNDFETTITVADPTSDKTITFPDTTGTVVTTGDTGTVATGMIAADAIDGTKIADNAINSEHYVDGSIDLVHLSANSVNSSKIVDGSIAAADLASDSVSTVKIEDDAVTADKLADTSVTAGSYTATDLTVDAQGRITAASSGTIAGSEIAADAIDGTKIADDSINSEHYVDGSIDTAHVADDAITDAKLADHASNNANRAVDSNHIKTNAIITEKIAGTAVTDVKLASNSVTESKILDANVTTDKIANDAVTIGKIGCEQTTISDSDSHIPTSGAVVDYVAAQIAPIGGLEVIADEDNFPTSQPNSGVVISISDAAGIVVNGSGVSTTARTAGNGSDNVTINNFPSSLYGETLATGVGLMVSSTGSSHTYNYHKILAAETDVKQLSDDINDFNARYRVNAGEPGSSNDTGDLVFDTNASKMKVYDGSSWGEVTSTGEFKYLFLCPAGGTGAPTLDGSIATYDLRESSNSGTAASVTNAAQLIVSINGVVQKANTGTSAPAEGFALVDANTIIFGANLASGDSVFIIQIGSAVSIPTPGDGTVTAAKITSGSVTTAKIADANVTTAKIADDAVTADKLASDSVVSASIVDGAIVNADINASAAIARTKLANVDVVDDTTPQLGGDLDVNTNNISFGDSSDGSSDDVLKFGAGNDLTIFHNGSASYIKDTGTGNLVLASSLLQITNAGVSENMAKFTEDGSVELYYDNSKKIETTSAGVTVTGTVTDSKGDVRSIPLNSQSGAYVLVAADAGKTVYISAGGVTINENVFSAGDAVTIINNSSSDQSLTEGTGSMTLYNTADGTTGNRTLAGRGMCTLYWATASNAYISGSGLS